MAASNVISRLASSPCVFIGSYFGQPALARDVETDRKLEVLMDDAQHLWDRTVTVVLKDEKRVIESPSQARTILLIEWPAERTDKHKIASETCLAAMEGAAPEAAWVAFIDVAIEAGIFVE